MVRDWTRLKYHDPKEILLGLRDIAIKFPLSEMPYKVASLRTRELRQYGESRQCALFCYGMSKFLGTKILYAQYEASDYDFVAVREVDDILQYTPIQMKEIVPDTVNTKSTLDSEISKLCKYVDSKNLVVGIHVNRAGKLDLKNINIPKLNIAELWFFAAADENQSKWYLFGNMLKENPRYLEFDYPK